MRTVPLTGIFYGNRPIFLPGGRNFFLLRLGLFAAVTGILFTADVDSVSLLIGCGILSAFLASHFWTCFLPSRSQNSAHLRVLIILADTFLLAFILTLTGVGSARIYLFFFLMILIIALGEGFFRILLAAGFITLVFCFGSLGWKPTLAGLGGIPDPVLIPFFAIVALYYGYIVAETRHREAMSNQTVRERSELRAILKILETTNSSLDFHTVMHETTLRLAELLDSARVSIVLVDQEKQECNVLTSSDDRNLNRYPLQLSKYPEIRQAMKSGKPVIIQDIETCDLVAEVREELRRLGFRSLLVIPLRYGEEIFGTICLRASREKKGFAPDEVRFTQIVASAAANAVKNSLLYRRVQEESRRHGTKARQLQLLFDQLPDLIFSIDLDGKISDWNRSAARRTGFSREEMLGGELNFLWPEAPPLPSLLQDLREEKPLQAGEIRLRRKDGPALEVRLTFWPIAEAGREIQGVLGIAQDISPEKLAEVKLMHADRLASVGELVATVAHELRNRLTGVLGFSQLVAIKNKDPKIARDLERISSSAEQCKKIVNDLLNFSRKSDPDRKALGVNGILRKALDLVERQLEESGIEVVKDFQKNLPFCLLDFQQIQQVFLNLLTNAQQAISATKKRGKIIVRTRIQGKDVVVSIEDNGPGMTPEVLGRIFDPFFTTKPAEIGTGLGLSISFGIVESHEGRFDVESEPGKGTRFHLHLPITDTEPNPEVVEERQDAPADQRILVVDDDPTIIDLYMAILNQMGHRVDTATNGIEACNKLTGNRYSLIISDLKMPKMNGMEFLKEIQKKHPEMQQRFVFTTGDLNYMNSHEFIMLADIPCLVKPLDIQEVERVVDKILAL